MVNEKALIKKIATFLNSLSLEEMVFFRRLMMSRKWQTMVETRMNNKQIEL